MKETLETKLDTALCWNHKSHTFCSIGMRSGTIEECFVAKSSTDKPQPHSGAAYRPNTRATSSVLVPVGVTVSEEAAADITSVPFERRCPRNDVDGNCPGDITSKWRVTMEVHAKYATSDAWYLLGCKGAKI